MDLDLEAIRARWELARRGDAIVGSQVLNEDMPALLAEIERLRAELVESSWIFGWHHLEGTSDYAPPAEAGEGGADAR